MGLGRHIWKLLIITCQTNLPSALPELVLPKSGYGSLNCLVSALPCFLILKVSLSLFHLKYEPCKVLPNLSHWVFTTVLEPRALDHKKVLLLPKQQGWARPTAPNCPQGL